MPSSLQQDTSTPPLTIRLLGAPTWRVNNRGPEALSPKDAALLAKLALDGPQPRLALCELLWPASGPKQAADSLRQRSHRLASAAGHPVLELGDSVSLYAGVRVDVVHLSGLDIDTLVDAPGLLAGVDVGKEADLDAWLGKARTRVEEQRARLLTDHAEALEREGRLHEALRLALRVVEGLPFVEQGWRRVMRLHYLRGDRAAAQDAYWRLHALLRDELGARPSAETQALFQTVETADNTTMLPRRPVPVSLLRPPVLVGRRAPWAAMVNAWSASRPFVLVGEGGLGKSRLLEAFVHGREGLVSEQARPGDDEVAGALLGRLLVRIDEAHAPDVTAAARAELARLRPEFGTPPRADANVAVLRHAVETMLASAVSRGLRVIAVDDVHNADHSSIQALRWLSASAGLAGLRMAFASRPWRGEMGVELDAWSVDSHRFVRVDLLPLTRPELGELLASLALPALIDPAVEDRLFRHAGGHPLFTLATLQHAVARGNELRDVDAAAAPESVVTLLDARIRGVPARARDLLQVAATGGADLTVERAAGVLGSPPLALSDAWAALEADNVLRGEAFSHDLVHEAALRAVPRGVQQALHRRWAEVLQGEPSVEPARLARHWEAGQRSAQAGRAWSDAAAAARLAGRLAEQGDLYERAARCHAEAGQANERVDALLARLDGLLLRHGGAAVLDALVELEPATRTSQQRLRCRIARTEALIVQGQIDDALAQASRSLGEVDHMPELAITVRAQHALALARLGRIDDAAASAMVAMQLAQASREPAQVLKAANALMFVHWSAGRIADAVSVQRQEFDAAEALGDQAVMAASEGSLAALLAAAGDVPGTYEHASRARQRHRDCGLAENSTPITLNHTVLGAACGALGRFDEARHALEHAVALAQDDAPVDVRAKALLTLTLLWVNLGCADRARAALAALPAEMPPGMQMQACWLAARAADMEGEPAARHWDRFDRLAQAHTDLPFVLGVDFEVSYRGPAASTIDRLERAASDCVARGQHGVARSLRWRMLARRLEGDDPASVHAAVVLALELEPHVNMGLMAKCYPPQVWLDMARAHERAGDMHRRSVCLGHGRRWVVAALGRMAPEWREAFSSRQPINRVLLAASLPT